MFIKKCMPLKKIIMITAFATADPKLFNAIYHSNNPSH